MITTNEKLLSVEECAAIAGVHIVTVYLWVARHKFNQVWINTRNYLIPERELMEFLERREEADRRHSNPGRPKLKKGKKEA
jgi:excisionase family DNA binding protein